MGSESDAENLTIGAFARAAGVPVETLRFYRRRGLLPEPERPFGSIRRCGGADVARVKFVKSAQRLAEVRARLPDLRQMEGVLSKLLRECKAHRGRMSCPVIDALHGEVGIWVRGEVARCGSMAGGRSAAGVHWH